MRFFLAGRDRVTGSVRLVSEITFSSRQDALDSLSSLLPVDGSFDGLDLFVADIEQATPVVVYKPVVVEPLVGMPVEAPMADAWESPSNAVEEAPLEAAVATVVSVEEPYADAVIAQIEAAIAEPASESTGESPEPLPLVEALRRAAERMEAEGVVAPEPVGESTIADDVMTFETVDEEPAAVEAMDEAPAAVEAIVDAPAAPAPIEPEAEQARESTEAAPERPIEPPVATQWPWEAAGVESAPVQAQADAEAAPAAIEEHAGDGVSMLTAPADDFVPKPVIMGDYGATLAADVAVSSEPVPEMEPAESDQTGQAEAEVPAEPASQVPTEPMGLRPDVEFEQDAGTVGGPIPVYVAPAADAESDAELDDELDGAGLGEQSAPESGETRSEPEPLDDLLAAIADSAAPVAEPKAYSHSGMDMNAYTCDDCVYVGTCPKAHEDSPATCGSFQWKSV